MAITRPLLWAQLVGFPKSTAGFHTGFDDGKREGKVFRITNQPVLLPPGTFVLLTTCTCKATAQILNWVGFNSYHIVM